jgi:DNA-directed RNA polymerase specialized sigma24 family protein
MEISDRGERILALLLLNQMKGSSQREKALQLSIAGFSNAEIADLIQTSAAVVAQVLYAGRKKKRARR